MAEPKDPSDKTKTAVAESDTLKISLEEARERSAALVIISGKPLGKSFVLSKDQTILGRDLTADISLGENAVSRRHTEFVLTADGVVVKDMGSMNGTFVNDQKIDSRLLEDGDLVRCGNTILKFLKEGKIENIHYERMYDLATRDDLTGVLNKKAITDRIHEEFGRARAKGLPLTLLLFDLDFFKKVNDTFGHPAGDYVLKETCNLVKNKMIRQKDELGRYGGEEFALLLMETPLHIAVDISERIRTTIEKHDYTFDGKKMPITVSIGVAAIDSTSKSPDDLVQLVDKALYDAKNQGRNRVCVR